nr:hypothetical protein [Bacteroidota bacterium]
MEALIIIVVIAIASYVIYINLPRTRFIKADKLLSANKFENARLIFEKLIHKRSLALSRYAECFYREGIEAQKKNELDGAKTFFKKAIDAKELMATISDHENYSIIETNAHFEIAQIMFSEIERNDTKETINEYKNNLKYISQVKNKKKENKFKALENKHHEIIAEIYYALGLAEEQSNNIIDAKRNYTKTISLLKGLKKDLVFYNAFVRSEICKLKMGEEVDSGIHKQINKVPDSIKNDFYYRYTINLIKQKQFAAAEKLLKSKLKSDNSEVEILRKICLAEKMKYADNEISIINKMILHLYEKDVAVEDVLNSYNYISSRTKEIVEIIPEVKGNLTKLVPSLLNRILAKYYDNKQYWEVIEIISQYQNFSDSPVLMKNIGNACINCLDEGSLNDQNYKMLISMFLTSSYNDHVMLHSLKETAWDDEYTFSLSDSIGSYYEFHSELPDNVNYDEITESNISIGESQRFLLNQFEELINEKIIDDDLLSKVYAFYNYEKGALDKIVNFIEDEVIIATPFFAQSFQIQDTILFKLEDFYNEYGDEEALEVGELYNTEESSSIIFNFSEAKGTFKKIIESIRNGDHSKLKKVISNVDVDLLTEYETISEKVEIEIVQTFQKIIEDDDENEKLLPVFKEAIKISPTKDKIKYLYADYTAGLCVSKINSGKMTNFTGLQIMRDAYLTFPNDNRVCKNIVSLIRMNIMDILNDKSNYASEIYSLLDEIKMNMKKTFRYNTSELVEARNDIVSQFSREDMAAIMAGINLSYQGRQLRKGIDYLE